MVARLIQHIDALGLEGTAGDAYRDPRLHGEVGIKRGYGHAKSAHKNRLAIDINLFENDVFVTVVTPSYVKVGEFWESLAPDARWGGRFNDPNHYSIEHDGIK